MNSLLDRAEHSIRTRGLLRPGQPLLVAVSGGVDSMVLLHVLRAISPEHGWTLAVAHLNHGLRGRSSDADERLVVRTARRLGLKVVVERAEVASHARTGRLSLEMAARELRHGFLARTAARLKIPTIALAHHADDQLELFFLRLFRGSGSEGLAGMKWMAPSPARGRNSTDGLAHAVCRPERLRAESRLGIIRPLLGMTKSELEGFARAHKIPFREDASNASLDIQRNRIRHELLPLLRRRYQPALDRTVLRVMEIAGAEAEFIGQVAGKWLAEDTRSDFLKLPVAIQRRVVQLQLLQQRIGLDYELVEQLRTSPGCPVAIAPRQIVVLDPGGVLSRREAQRASPDPAPVAVTLRGIAGKIVFGNLKISWRMIGHPTTLPPKPAAGREFFDADKVGREIILRHWRPGDRFQPIGMSSPVKLQDLFVNQKIARARRHELVVASTAEGEVFWVEQLRISERFKLSKRTNRRLQWRWNLL